jgi:hypothetical protein
MLNCIIIVKWYFFTNLESLGHFDGHRSGHGNGEGLGNWNGVGPVDGDGHRLGHVDVLGGCDHADGSLSASTGTSSTT